MRVLILGATGSIGTAVAAELKDFGHQVVGLARTANSAGVLKNLGYGVVIGDIRAPADWSNIVNSVDAIVQVAVTFTDDMGAVDRCLIEELHRAVEQRPIPLRFIYTGGCWLYGATGDTVADEMTPFQPIASFAWMVENAAFILAAERFNTAVIHPAMTYCQDGGILSRFAEQAAAQRSIEIWGNQDVRWPLVHRDDLATAYRLMLERPDLTGHFNVSAEEGVRVGELAAEIAKRYGNHLPFIVRTRADVVAEYGGWAEGPILDQQMSSAKIRTATGWRPKRKAPPK